ncbi:MAG TPA: hypothetical protein VNX18_02035 [Bryobacteraceae bacterium]|nr:hypothetical protein [Bryobacteraceae bacterium]
MLKIPMIALLAAFSFAADSDGAAVYKQTCAMCHDASDTTRAPGNVLLVSGE